jgi:hypothetical protein
MPDPIYGTYLEKLLNWVKPQHDALMRRLKPQNVVVHQAQQHDKHRKPLNKPNALALKLKMRAEPQNKLNVRQTGKDNESKPRRDKLNGIEWKLNEELQTQHDNNSNSSNKHG